MLLVYARFINKLPSDVVMQFHQGGMVGNRKSNRSEKCLERNYY
jgi:hypothetical protein